MKWHFGKSLTTSAVLGMVLLFGGSVRAECFISNCDFAVHGDYLYWKAQTDSLLLTYPLSQFAEVANTASEAFVTNKADVQQNTFDYDWKNGFRVGASFGPRCSCFTALFDWTHQLGAAHRGCGKALGAQADWNLHLDFFDACLSRSFKAVPYFEVRPFLGVRYARLWQKYTSDENFVFSIVDTEGGGQFIESASCLEQHLFRGAGPKIGGELFWCLRPRLGAYGAVALSGLVGSSTHTVRDTLATTAKNSLNFPEFGAEGTFQRKENVQANRWILDLSLGLETGRVCTCCGEVRLKAGWEYHAIYGQKLAYFGQDFLPALLSQFNGAEAVSPIDFDLGLFDVKRQPSFTGSCGTTLALQGLVVSLLIDF